MTAAGWTDISSVRTIPPISEEISAPVKTGLEETLPASEGNVGAEMGWTGITMSCSAKQSAGQES